MDQNNSEYEHFLRSVYVCLILLAWFLDLLFVLLLFFVCLLVSLFMKMFFGVGFYLPLFLMFIYLHLKPCLSVCFSSAFLSYGMCICLAVSLHLIFFDCLTACLPVVFFCVFAWQSVCMYVMYWCTCFHHPLWLYIFVPVFFVCFLCQSSYICYHLSNCFFMFYVLIFTSLLAYFIAGNMYMYFQFNLLTIFFFKLHCPSLVSCTTFTFRFVTRFM